jgi:Tol biopolymer transport system component
VPNDLSSDGKTLLLSENREGGGPAGSVYLRRNPEEPAVRLGDGLGLALSPDGKWALGRSAGKAGGSQQLLVLPTGTGEQRVLSTGPLHEFLGAAWLPDGKGVIVRASEAGKGPRLYVVGIAPGQIRAISAEGANGAIAISPDGAAAACRIVQQIQIFSLTSPGVRPLPGQSPGETPIRWTPDGKALYVFRPGDPPVDVFRVDAATGARDPWKRLAPADAAGVESVSRVFLTEDGNGYVYGYGRRSSDLYVVEGLR